MPTYSQSLRVELITPGTEANTWGTITNNNFAYVFDAAIAGYQTVSVTSASQAFTYNNGPVSTASLNQSVYAMLRLTTTTAANFAVYAPPNPKQYIIWNNSGYAATIYNSTVIGNTTAAGTGVTIADGDRVLVWSNGTNFYEIKTGNITGTVAIANGGTGQTTQQAAINALVGAQTANRVLRSDGTNSTLAQVALATDVSGTLAIANGGSGQSTAQGAINAFAGAVTLGQYLRGNGTNVVMSTIQAADVPTLNQNTTGTAGGLSATLAVGSGGTGQTTYTDGQLLIGNSTGNTLTKATLTAGSGVTIANASGSITISATGSGGTVTSVTGTSPVVSSGGTTPAISLAANYGDTSNPYASKTANFVLAAPDGAAGAPTFRGLVAADVPTLNQNTTGTAAGLSATLAIGSGGTGTTTAQGAMNTFAGAVTAGSYLRGNGTNVVMATIQAADVPTLNQNTTGNAATATKLTTTSFSIEESGGKLIFKYNATTIASMDSAGVFTALSDVTGGGTP